MQYATYYHTSCATGFSPRRSSSTSFFFVCAPLIVSEFDSIKSRERNKLIKRAPLTFINNKFANRKTIRQFIVCLQNKDIDRLLVVPMMLHDAHEFILSE